MIVGPDDQLIISRVNIATGYRAVHIAAMAADDALTQHSNNVHGPNETTCGHVSKLFVRQSRVDVRKYFFGNRVVKIWNSLPATVEDFASIRKFRSFIERVNLSQYVNF